jgi:hypothetical protein
VSRLDVTRRVCYRQTMMAAHLSVSDGVTQASKRPVRHAWSVCEDGASAIGVTMGAYLRMSDQELELRLVGGVSDHHDR